MGMRYTVVAVGKLKERFWTDACAEYLKRLQPYAKCEVRELADVDPSRVGGDAASVEREGAAILAALASAGNPYTVLLDIGGKSGRAKGCRVAWMIWRFPG